MVGTTYIYGLESEKDGIRYIGKSDYPHKRLAVHRCKSAQKNPHLHRWLEANNVTLVVLDKVPKASWQFWERWYIELFKSWDISLVNISNGGDGCDGYRHNEEAKSKMRLSHKDVSGSNNPMFGKLGINNPNFGRKNTEDTIQRMRLRNLGSNNPSFGKLISNFTRKKLSIALGTKVTYNNITYSSIREMCQHIGIDRCTYRYRTSKGFVYENGSWIKL